MPFQINMFWACVGLPAGLLILLKAADILVDGAVALAERLGVSPLVVGLTIVAMGTSAPEVAASITAALGNLGDVAVGNVYGSNVANLALVGGICAIIRPLSVRISVQQRELPVMLIVTVLLYPALSDLFLSRSDSFILIAIFAAMIVFTVVNAVFESRSRPAVSDSIKDQIHETTGHAGKSLSRSVVFILLGLAGLALGAHLTVESSVFLGKKAGLSDAVIGLTIIAVGTSLPELMTSLVAAMKGQDDISVGNLVGSNIFNTLLVIGTAGIIRPFSIDARFVGPDYWIMIAISAMFMVTALVRKKVGRFSGIALVTVYAAYMVYLFVFTRGA